MTYLELTRAIKALPAGKRLELIEVIKESLESDERPRTQNGSSLERLRGIAKPDGPAPSDAETDQLRAQYLTEKHA